MQGTAISPIFCYYMPLTLHFRIHELFDYSKNVYPDSTISDPIVPERWLTSGFIPKPC